MREEMDAVKCPGCDEKRVQRYGKTVAGLQKYRCQSCGRQFVSGSDHNVDPELKKIAQELLRQNVRPGVIAKAMDGKISVRWLRELRRQVADK